MPKNLLAFLASLVLVAGVVFSLSAQQTPSSSSNGSATANVTGNVRTPGGVPVPGATLRLVETDSGRALMSWTDENGRFSLPLPAGHYRIEASQLGFDTATSESDVAVNPPPPPIQLTLKVASLASLNAPVEAGAAPNQEARVNAQQPNSAQSGQASANQNPNTSAQANGGGQGRGGFRGRGGFGGGGGNAGAGDTTAGSAPADSANANGAGGFGRRGGAAPGRGGFAAGRGGNVAAGGNGPGGFQAVDLNANGEQQDQENADNAETVAQLAGPAAENEALGQASASDAFLMNGTVGQGDQNAGGFPGGDFGPGSAFGGPGAFGPGGGIPGVPGGVVAPGFGQQAGPGGAPVVIGGGPGGGFGGGPGAGPGFGGGGGPVFIPGGGGGGGRGGGGGGGRGGGPGRGGNAPARGAPQQLFGLARLAQQRANRVRFNLTDTYSNSALNARPYSLTGVEAPKIGSWNENLGGSVGGPLRIPKVYDGSSKTFFFVNFNVVRGRTAVDQYSTVPTLAERAGDFSDRAAQLFNPFSSASGARTALGSVIPAGMISPTAQGLLQYIPAPNSPGLVQNYHLQGAVPRDQEMINARIQHTISNTLHFQAVYNIQIGSNEALQNFPGFERTSSTRGQSLTLGLTQNFSRTMINNVQFFFTRNRNSSLNQYAFAQNIAGGLGITGISTAPIDWGYPQLTFTNFTDPRDPVPSLSRNETFRFVDNFTLIKTKHTFRIGAEARKMLNSTLTNPTPRGAFTFSGAQTSQLDASGRPIQGTGLDFADFLLGLPASTNLRFGTPATYFHDWAFSGFFNDDWRVTPRFSLTWGVRYEAVTPWVEKYGHIANLDVNSSFTQAAVVVPGTPGLFSGALPSSLVRGDYNNFAPRIGIAWRPPIKHQVVIRSGYSIMYNSQLYNQFATSMASQPPFAQAQTLQSTASQVLTIQNGFPTTAPNTLRNTIAIDPNYTLAYAQVWNFSLETPLFRNAPFSIVYTGTKGTHLDTLLGFAGTNNLSLASGQTTVVQNAQGFTYDTSAANSIFHALQFRLQGRLSRYLRFGAQYTLSKSVDDASTIGGGQQVIVQDVFNIAAQRGLSSFDVRHQFNANIGYDLPFGERRQFARSGWASSVFGDWTLTSTFTARSGNPFTALVYDSACQILPGMYSERANEIGDPSLSSGDQTVQHFFNTAAFAAPTGGCIGNAPRNTIIGPGSFNVNLQARKTIRLDRENQKRMDIGLQVNNLTNQVNLTGLSTVVNSATFGRVTGAGPMRSMSINARINF